jgi:hypothetical protein
MVKEGEITRCGTCFSSELVTVLDLGSQPLAEGMGDTKTYPLRLVKCLACSLVQLSYIVPQAEVFPWKHPFTTGNSTANRKHFHGLALKVRDMTSPGDLVVDIGANDGTFLAELSMVAPTLKVVGVEPTWQAEKARAKGLGIVGEFFTSGIARRITQHQGLATVVTASNVLAHVPDPHDFLHGVGWLLDPREGVFITENHDWESIERGLQVDTIYHEHLRYYSVGSLAFQLARSSFNVMKVEPTEQHGGSFRTYARPQKNDSLASRAGEARAKLLNLVNGLHAEGKVIYGVGAATRASTLIHWAQLAPFLDRILEVSTSDKIGYLMPGTDVPVVDEKVMFTDPPDYALMLSWHIAQPIMRSYVNKGYNGDFIIPLPDPHIVKGYNNSTVEDIRA